MYKRSQAPKWRTANTSKTLFNSDLARRQFPHTLLVVSVEPSFRCIGECPIIPLSILHLPLRKVEAHRPHRPIIPTQLSSVITFDY